MIDHETDRLGTVLFDRGCWALRYEREFSHPPHRVWRALTSSEDLRNWFPCDLVGDREAGASLRLPFWTEHIDKYQTKYDVETPEFTGTIRIWDPPSVFEWTWDVDLLRFDLTPIDGGTRLVFTTWLALFTEEPGDAPLADTAAGYHVCLDELRAVLDIGKVGPIDDGPVGALKPRYEAAISALG